MKVTYIKRKFSHRRSSLEFPSNQVLLYHTYSWRSVIELLQDFVILFYGLAYIVKIVLPNSSGQGIYIKNQ